MGKKGHNYLAWDVRADDFREDLNLSDQIRFLLNYAVLAPSTHNSQPWRFRVSENELWLDSHQERLLPIADPFQRLLGFSLGAALENILIAADFFGFQTEYERYDTSLPAYARVRFLGRGEQSQDPQHLLFSIPKRCTNRGPFAERAPEQSFLDLALDSSDAQVRVDIITEDEIKHRFVDLLMQGNRQNFANSSFRRELAGYKRHNLTRSSLGIPGFAMGFSTPFSFVAPHLIRHVDVMKTMGDDFERLLKRSTPAFLLLSSAEDNKQHWLQLGQKMQSLMLEAQRSGLQTALQALPQQVDAIRKLFDMQHRPQICIRLGYGQASEMHSPRLMMSEVSDIHS